MKMVPNYVLFHIGIKALKLVNYTELMGKELNLSWYRTGGVRDKVTGNIFVKGLHSDTTSKDLYTFFSQFGAIFSCRAKYATKGNCKGYGYIQFETKESAEKAIAEGNGKEIKGKKIEVMAFISREQRNSSLRMHNNLFIKNIPKRFTNDDLKSMFACYGEIVSAVAIKDSQDSKENKGFGFVCFKNSEDAKTAEEKLKNTPMEGQNLYISRALPKQEHKRKLREDRYKAFKDCNLYVKRLPEGANDEKMKVAFEEFGKVISARVMMDKKEVQGTGKIEYVSRGFGFVCFSNTKEARNAISEAAKKDIMGTKLYVAIAERKEERRTRLGHRMLQFPGQYPMPMYGIPPPMFPPQFEGGSRPRNVSLFITKNILGRKRTLKARSWRRYLPNDVANGSS